MGAAAFWLKITPTFIASFSSRPATAAGHSPRGKSSLTTPIVAPWFPRWSGLPASTGRLPGSSRRYCTSKAFHAIASPTRSFTMTSTTCSQSEMRHVLRSHVRHGCGTGNLVTKKPHRKRQLQDAARLFRSLQMPQVPPLGLEPRTL